MSEMPFGKYSGCEIETIPSDYLDWLLGLDNVIEKYPRLTNEMQKELDTRERSNAHFYTKHDYKRRD